MYYRQKEDDVEKTLCDIGFELKKDVARRFTEMGDKIMYCENTNTLLVVDNKSTTNKTMINITKDMLEKIRKEAKAYDPNAIGVITITLYGSKNKYMIIEIEDDFRRLLYGI